MKNSNERKTKTVWVTRYALTRGVYTALVWYTDDSNAVHTLSTYNKMGQRFETGKTCFDTLGEATAHASNMANKKIANLKRQIAKLENLAMSPKVVMGRRLSSA